MNDAHFNLVSSCRLCGSKIDPVVALAEIAVASPNVGASRRSAETAPADICQCANCGFLQLPTVVDPEFQYRGFRYVTSLSGGLREHFAELMSNLAAQGELGYGRLVLDVGSNDGTLLALARQHGSTVLGVDPAVEIAAQATANGIETIAEFFTVGVAKSIVSSHGRAAVIISNNTVANIDDISGLFDAFSSCLTPDGLIVIETQYALDVLEKFLLDVVYHEHISYFAVSPTKSFLEARGFELVDAEPIAPKGGSIRFLIQRAGGPRAVNDRVAAMIDRENTAGLYNAERFQAFSQKVATIGQELRDVLARSRVRSGRALAYGSSVGSAALIQYFGLAGYIDAVFDDHPLTNVIRTAAGNIPVLAGAQLANEPPTEVVVLAWRYADEIAARQALFTERGGRFLKALPEVTPVQ